MIGTLRKNRKDLPKCLLDIQDRATYSSHFRFGKDITLVSYVTKPKKIVVLLSSLHHEFEIAGEDNKFKPEIILSYNATKSGVDVLDKLIREYSCKRATRRWPLRLFLNFLDIACYNAFVIWICKNPNWLNESSIKTRRKSFLEDLGLALANENILRRRTQIINDGRGFSRATCSAIESTGMVLVKNTTNANASGVKRGRCHQCRGNDNKFSAKCDLCKKFVCPKHSTTVKQKQIACHYCKKDEDGEPL